MAPRVRKGLGFLFLESPVKNVEVFIDGFNAYHSIADNPALLK